MSRVLGLRTEVDSVLSVVAPLGLAAAAVGPALMIDLDPHGPAYPGQRSLADLVSEGPTRLELSPAITGGTGVALLRNGGIGWSDAAGLITSLSRGWSSIVLRIGAEPGRDGAEPLPWPVIPVIPILPGVLAPTGNRAAVWQATVPGAVAPGPGPVLPLLGRTALTALLNIRVSSARRWVKAWRQVWGLPWP